VERSLVPFLLAVPGQGRSIDFLLAMARANQKAIPATTDFRKTLEISGPVDSIGRNVLDTIYVTFVAGHQFEAFRVQCFFAEKQKQKAAKLSKGDWIAVRGRCDGRFLNVIIKDCEIIQAR
jgi:hypothetical protein